MMLCTSLYFSDHSPSTEFCMQLCGQPWRSTTSASTLSESTNTYNKANQCSPLERQHRRLVPSNSRNPPRMSSLTYPLQHISGKDHNRCLGRSRRRCQHWRQNSYQFPLCWWHQWLSRRGRKLAKLVEWLDKASTAYFMKISGWKTELMTHNTNGINQIKVNEQKLETVISFKYLGSVITDEGSKTEILCGALTTLAFKGYMTMMKMWLMCRVTNSCIECLFESSHNP